MTATTLDRPVRLRSRRVTRPMLGALALAGVGLSALLHFAGLVPGHSESVILAAVFAVLAVFTGTWAVEGRRVAVDRFATALAVGGFVLAMIPLVAVLGYVIARGSKAMSVGFLTHSMAGVGALSSAGGVSAAIIGTVEQVLLASLMSVPLGVLVAIYTAEYGRGPLAAGVRFLIDVMTGLPSIVAGLFVFAFWVIGLHQGFSGFAGSLALAILMLPIVVRSTEEMIRLVPRTLREASYALGVARWRTVLSVVLPTALTGITTGVMLAVARVTGETAPLLLTIGGNSYTNANPFSGHQSSLSLFVFDQAGRAFVVDINRAWAGALTLIVFVVVLYVAARVLTRRNALARR